MAIYEVPTLQLLVVVLVLTGIWFYSKRRSSVKHLLPGTRVPPCLMSIPILGSLPFVSVDSNKLHINFMELSNKYGHVFGLHLGNSYAVVLNGYEAIEEALLKKATHFADRLSLMAFDSVNADGKGIVFAAYNKMLRQNRKNCLSIMKKFGFGQRLMETRINGEVNELIKQARLIDGKPFDPNEMIHMCIVNVISSILLGQRYEFNDPLLKELEFLIHESMNNVVGEVEVFPFLRFLPPFRQRFTKSVAAMKAFMKALEYKIDVVVQQANGEQDDISDINDSFIGQFIKSTPTGEDYDREELLQTARDLFQGGDDASSTTLLWILVHLANHPEVQNRLQSELDSVVGVDRLPSLADEANMPYTQAFILETMRRRTLAPLALFHRTMCDTQVGDCFVPAGTTVIVNLYSAHMDPKEWDDPISFRPERFIDDFGQIRDKERVISFSLGKRSCLGESLARQEFFLFTCGIVQNFDVRPPEGQDKITCEEVTHFLTEPSAFQVRLIRRQTTEHWKRV